MALAEMLSASQRNSSGPVFVDLFAGCGGLSLGMIFAGWRGLLAVERDKMALETFISNLVEGGPRGFEWPHWFPKKACSVQVFAKRFEQQLLALRGSVALVAGGPPRPGFSFAGHRRPRGGPPNRPVRALPQGVDPIQPPPRPPPNA